MRRKGAADLGRCRPDSPRATLVSQWYAPEPITTPVWIVGALRRRGFSVNVLTGVPNFPSGVVVPGYSALRPQDEVIDDVLVHRAALYPSHDRSPVRRALNYLSWAVCATWSARRALADTGVALVYSSPATAALPAMVARRLFGVPFVLLIQDVWPDSIVSTGLAGRGRLARSLARAVDVFVRASYRAASKIVCTSPGMVDLLRSRGVPESKLSLVYNWIDEREFVPAEPVDLRDRLGLANHFVVMYAGNHGAAQGLDVLIAAMGRLADHPDVHLVFVGDGVEKAALRRAAERVAPERIHFLDPVPSRHLPGVLAAADVQVIALADDPLFTVTMPSKVQATLSCGLPMLVVAGGDAGDVPRRARNGWSAPPGDPDAVAAALLEARVLDREALRRMGANGRAYYLEQMSEQVSGRRLADVLLTALRKEN
jgi:colanic acid biosynthesis glycosyl transferase WcaI